MDDWGNYLTYINKSNDEVGFLPYIISSEEYEEYNSKWEVGDYFFQIWVKANDEWHDDSYSTISEHTWRKNNDIAVIDIIDAIYKDAIPTDSQKKSVKILHRFLYTKKELDKIHWKITYPPKDK